MLAYVNGFFAGLSGCVLPVLSIMITKKEKFKFLLEFFISQFILFSILNLAYSIAYSFIQWIQPILLLIASIITFYSAYNIYMHKNNFGFNSGALYGIALSPCSIGFAIATVATSFKAIYAIFNAFLFSLGIITPLLIIAIFIKKFEKIMNKWDYIEKLSVVLLIIVSYYLAYLAGASWRW